MSARSPYWHGMLCVETLDEIADRMQEVLGEHYFTVVLCNSYSEESHHFAAVDVRTSQWLTRPIEKSRVYRAGLSWSTPWTSMGVGTEAKTRAEAHDGGPHKYVHFTFQRDQVVIDHYAPARYKLRWILTVEHHDRGDVES